jgi:hypothetical protein
MVVARVSAFIFLFGLLSAVSILLPPRASER